MTDVKTCLKNKKKRFLSKIKVNNISNRILHFNYTYYRLEETYSKYTVQITELLINV